MYIILYRKEKKNGEKKKSVVIKKWHCTICTICTLIRESAESAKSAKQKNTIFIQAAKMEEEIFLSVQNSPQGGVLLLTFVVFFKKG